MKKFLLPAIIVFLVIIFLTGCPSPSIKPKPGVPSNPSPVDSSNSFATSIDLSWSCTSPDNTTLVYDVYLGTSSGSLKKLFSVTSETIRVSDLIPGNTYYWKVIAKNPWNEITTGPLWSFSVSSEKPYNPSPEDSSRISGPNVTLSWESYNPGNTGITYDLNYGVTPEATRLVENISDNFYELDNLAKGSTYYWKIVAKTASGYPVTGDLWSFSINNPPEIDDLSPSNGASETTRTVELVWNGVDSDNDNLTYSVYFGTTPSPSLLATGLEEPSYSVPTLLEHGTTYYWKVEGNDGFDIVQTTVHSFAVEANLAPKINSMSPSDEATVVSIYSNLSWNCTDPNGDPMSYSLYFGNTPSPSILATGLVSSSYSFVAPLEYSKTYYWKIEAVDSYGESAESQLHSFTTEANLPPIFDSMSPTDNSTNTLMTTNLIWNFTDPNVNPLTYTLFFGESSTPSQRETGLRGSNYSFENPLKPLTTYYWKVSADDGYGGTAESPVYRFTTKSNSSPTINSISPSDGAGAISVSTSLYWNVSDSDGDSLSYTLYFGNTPSPNLLAADLNTNTYSFGITLNPSTTYYWKIIADDGMGETTESPVYEFTTSINISYTLSRYGGNDTDVFYTSLEETSGGYIFAGYTESSDFTDYHGGMDAWIVKLDSEMEIEWQKCLGGTNLDKAESVKETSDGGYIIAGWTKSSDGNVSGNSGGSDAWIVKLDSTGNITWEKSFGGTGNDYGKSILEVSDGYLFAGFTDSDDEDVSGNNGGRDAWIVKLDSAGNFSWQKCFGGTGDEEIYNLQETSDINYIIAGYTSSKGNGEKDAWVIKFDSGGSIVWEKTFGGSGLESASSIAGTSDGGFIFTGYTQSQEIAGHHGSRDVLVVRLDSAGEVLWQKCLGGSSLEEAYGVAETSDGDFILSGYTYSNDGDISDNHGISDAWLVNLNSSGNILWQRCIGGSSSDYANSVLEVSPGKYLAAGNTSSTDGDMEGGYGSSDAWVGIIEEQ